MSFRNFFASHEPQRPQLPPRPSLWDWQRMSDLQRDAYLAQVYDWLEAQQMDPRWLATLLTMAEWYQAYTLERIADPNWKRGGRD